MVINIFTVWRSGGGFDREYVRRLRRGIKFNLELEHRFVCLTDDVRETDYDTEDMIQWEPLQSRWPAHWAKVEMFNPTYERYGRILYIDLSTIVVGDLTEIATWDAKPSCVTRDCPSQSILSFEPGSLRSVWDKFHEDPEEWIRRGDLMIPPNYHDQILMADMVLPYWQDELPGHVVSFKKDCLDGIPENARLVKFTGKPNPHEVCNGWVKHIWEEGKTRIDFVPVSNVSDQVSLGNMWKNSLLDIPWVQTEALKSHDVLICGGGPSLTEDLKVIELRQRHYGAEVWALNNVHDTLLDAGIVPDAMIMLDSRIENIEFIKRAHPDVTYYIAARCHPKILEALEGFKIKLWHPMIDDNYDLRVLSLAMRIRRERGGYEHDYYTTEMTGGGSTVGLRAMYLAWVVLGFKRFHLYGFDSSYRDDGEGHAYKQQLNTGDVRIPMWANDREFQTTAWMAKQVKGFQEQAPLMIAGGCEINVHGDGLLPYVAQLMG